MMLIWCSVECQGPLHGMRQSQGDLRAQPIRQPGAQIQGHNHYLNFPQFFILYHIPYFVGDLDSLQVKNSFSLSASQIKKNFCLLHILHTWISVEKLYLRQRVFNVNYFKSRTFIVPKPLFRIVYSNECPCTGFLVKSFRIHIQIYDEQNIKFYSGKIKDYQSPWKAFSSPGRIHSSSMHLSFFSPLFGSFLPGIQRFKWIQIRNAEQDADHSNHYPAGVQAGDLIQIIRKHPSGIWEGECMGRVGRFKFINVEELEQQLTPPAASSQLIGVTSPAGDQLTEETRPADTVSSLLARLEIYLLNHLTECDTLD